MAFTPLTRTTIRSRLQQKTAGQLTASADQDIYINDAEKLAISDWAQFDKGLVQRVKQTGTTTAAGLLLVDQGFIRLQRLQDANDVKYNYLDDPNSYPYSTGYYFAGFETTTYKRQFQILRQGVALVSTAMEWWDMTISELGSGTTTESAVPGLLIVYKAAELWWEDQGPAFSSHGERMRQKYEEILKKSEKLYRNPTMDPEYIESTDADAGEWGSEHLVY